MYKRFALGSLAILGLAAGAAAHADVTPGFYAGASLGESSIEVDGADFDASDTAFKVFGGYLFNQHFAVEASWFDGGAPDERAGPASVEVELTGLTASAVGRLPLGDAFTLFGKIGFTSYDAEIVGRVNGDVFFSEDGSDEDVSYGVGGEFAIGQVFGLRAEYEMIDVSGGSFNMLSLGGVFRF